MSLKSSLNLLYHYPTFHINNFHQLQFQMGKKHRIVKECLQFLVIREMQTTRYYFVPSKMAIIK